MILSKKNIDNIILNDLISNKIKTGKLNEFLTIVPTNRKLRRLKKEIISDSPLATATKINIETLSTLTANLLHESKSFIHLSEAASTIIIEQSAAEQDLQYFVNYDGKMPAGTLDKLRSVFYEYKRRGIQPRTLLNDIASLTSTEKAKAKDIKGIYECYLRKCMNLNAFEIGDIYNELLSFADELFFDNFHKLYPGVKIISVSGFDEFTIPEIEIIDRLSEIEGVLLFIDFDYYDNNQNLFSHLDECFARLIFMGFREREVIFDKSNSKFISEIEQNLFSYYSKSIIDANTNKTVIASQTKEKEIELIAKEIKHLIVNKKVIPSKIAVVFNLIDHYSFLIRDIFNNYGIPYNLTDRLQLSSAYPVIALINFLEILENDFYYKNLMRSLHSGFIGLDGINVTNIAAVAKELKIVAGKNTWLYKIEESIKKIKNSDDINPKRKIEKLVSVKNNISKISELLHPFGKELTIREFLNEFLKLINNLKIQEKILSSSNGRGEDNIKSVSVLIETLNEIFTLLEREEGNTIKHDLSYYLNQIRTASGWARYNVKEKSNYGVLVTTLDEIRGLEFDYLFIAGLNDGELPTRYTPEIFYSKAFMQKKEKSHLNEQRYRFYQTLCSWKKELFLSFAKSDGKKELVESSFLKEIKKLYKFNIKTEKDYKTFIYNEEEILIEYGEAYFNKNLESIEGLQQKLPVSESLIEESIHGEMIRESVPLIDSVYNGILLPEKIIPREVPFLLGRESVSILENSALNEYSISQLETFAKCPFKYFVERILKLNIIGEPTEEIEAIEMGSLLHEILFDFYKSMRDKKLSVADDFIVAKKIIFSIARQKIDLSGFDSPASFYEKEKIFGLNGDEKKSILYKFLEEEKKSVSQKPQFFEVSFGRRVNDEIDEIISDEKPLNIDRINLRGKIDRVDIDSSCNGLTVLDYKLGGKNISSKDLYRGIQLQLPVYLLAIQELLFRKSQTEYKPLGMEIYSLKYSEKDFGRNPIKLLRGKPSIQAIIEQNEKLIELISSFVKEYVRAISKGKFNISNHEDRENLVCRYCDLKKTCRVQNLT